MFFFNIMLSIPNKLIFSISRRILQWSAATRHAIVTYTHTHTHTHTTHFRANAPSITSSKKKVKNNLPYMKK